LSVLRLVDGVRLRPDHFDAVFRQHAHLVELQRAVQRGLSAHGGEQRVRLFLRDDLRDDFGRDWLDIGRVRKLRIGHDRRRIGIHQNDPIALFFQGLDRLCSGIVELASLPDNDRVSANYEDRGDVSSFWH